MSNDPHNPPPDPALLLWEALDGDNPALEQARRLCEATQAPDEQIPWKWIAGAVEARKEWRPGSWAAHLVLAGPRPPTSPKRKREDAQGVQGEVSGFAYGIHLPGYGGYLSYLGVDPQRRRGGVGRRLIEVTVRLLQVDAGWEGDEL